MSVGSRTFVKASAAAASALALPSAALAEQGGDLPASIRALKPFPGRATPITDDERRARIEGSHALLSQKIKDNLSWQVLSKEDLAGNEKYRAVVVSQTNSGAADPATLLHDGARLRLRRAP